MIFILLFILICTTVFVAWIIFEKKDSKRVIRIPIILFLTFLIFITGISFGFYFFHLEEYTFNQNMKIIEERLRSNDLYPVKASIITYNSQINTMNNYKALNNMNQVLLDVDSE